MEPLDFASDGCDGPYSSAMKRDPSTIQDSSGMMLRQMLPISKAPWSHSQIPAESRGNAATANRSMILERRKLVLSAATILGLGCSLLAAASESSAGLKSKAAIEEQTLVQQNQRIQMLNGAPADFPTFIREGFKVRVVTSDSYVTSNTGLIYLDLQQGNGEAPKDGQEVVFNYVGYNESGRRIDSSYQQGQPSRTRLGTKGLIPGFEEGIKSMKPGGKRRIVVPPELGPPVGPSTFFSSKQFEVFDVELLDVRDCVRRTTLGFFSDVVCEGRQVHAQILQSAEHRHNRRLANVLVDMYGKCGKAEEAQMVFEAMNQPDVWSWNTLIAAYALNGHPMNSRSFFDRMPKRDVVSWNATIAAYAQNGHSEEARHTFDRMPKQNVVSWTAVLAAFVQNGHLQEAKSVFDEGPQQDVVSWTAMLAGYAQEGHLDEARDMLGKMPQWNVVSWNAMIQAYAQSGHLEEAIETFYQMPERNIVSWTAMLAAYAQKGHMDEAKRLFQIMPNRDVVACTAMISAYAQAGHLDESTNLFEKMPQWDVVSWTAMIQAYAQNVDTDKARQIFESMPRRTVISWNSMVAAYAVYGHPEEAQNMFQRMPYQDMVSWTTMIAAYTQTGHLDEARSTFENMPQRDMFAWNAMIQAYAQNGHSQETLELFNIMKLEGVKPNSITFVSILTGCNHGGMLNSARNCFMSMVDAHGITAPTIQHYHCMIDILGRAKQLQQAEDLINSMPFLADEVAWTTLIGGCLIHGDIERGERATKHALELDTQCDVAYILLSNMYAAAGRQQDAAAVRKAMNSKGLGKLPGCSSVERQFKVLSGSTP